MLQQMPILRRSTEEALPTRRLRAGAAGFPVLADLLVNRKPFLPHETDDTLLTGGTRSLNRRLLALNLETSLVRPLGAQRHDIGQEPLGRTA